MSNAPDHVSRTVIDRFVQPTGAVPRAIRALIPTTLLIGLALALVVVRDVQAPDPVQLRILELERRTEALESALLEREPMLHSAPTELRALDSTTAGFAAASLGALFTSGLLFVALMAGRRRRILFRAEGVTLGNETLSPDDFEAIDPRDGGVHITLKDGRTLFVPSVAPDLVPHLVRAATTPSEPDIPDAPAALQGMRREQAQ